MIRYSWKDRLAQVALMDPNGVVAMGACIR